MVFEFQCHVREHYGNHLQIFTDGSKDQETEATGAAFMVQRLKIESSKRTSDFLHVFTIELYAILMAIKWTEQLVNQKVLICSDSVSAITSIGVGTAKSHQDLMRS
jgi:ribonuclease HI